MKTKMYVYAALILSVMVYIGSCFSLISDVEARISLFIASLPVAYAFILYCIKVKVIVPMYDINLDIDIRQFLNRAWYRFICICISSIVLIQWIHGIHIFIEANGLMNSRVVLLGLYMFFHLLYTLYQILGEDTQSFFKKISYVYKRWIKVLIIIFCVVSASYNHSLLIWLWQTIAMLGGVLLMLFVLQKLRQLKRKSKMNLHYCDYFKKPSR